MKERGHKVLALIPLNLYDYLFNWHNGKTDEILRRLAADFTDESQFSAQIDRVVLALQTDESGP